MELRFVSLNFVQFLMTVDVRSLSDKFTINVQVTNPFQIPETLPKGFFESIRLIWTKLVNGLVDFITGESCRLRYTLFLKLFS